MTFDVLKVFGLSALSFTVGILITPFITNFLYQHKLWKKQARDKTVDGREATYFKKLHEHKEVGTPRMGGVVIVASVFITVILVFIASIIFPSELTAKLNFLSRNQTWLPLFTFFIAALIGLVDDVLDVTGLGNYFAGGLSLKYRIALIGLLGLIGGLWFYSKLEVTALSLPYLESLTLGWLIVPFFMLVMLAIYTGSVIDGIDGLAGGVMAIMYAAYAGIAFFQNQLDIATLSAVIVGGVLAFLWFNIPPARFYMSEVGIMGLTTALTVIAFLTDSVFALPIIAFPLIATSASVVIQLLSKKFRNGKKVFIVAPLHHHFEAIGWPGYKVTMRYWVLSIIFAIIGMVIALF